MPATTAPAFESEPRWTVGTTDATANDAIAEFWTLANEADNAFGPPERRLLLETAPRAGPGDPCPHGQRPEEPPMTPTTRPRSHATNRLTVVVDMANALIGEHAARMPRFSYRSVLDTVLSCACAMTDGQWLELGRRTGHYQEPGARPDQATIAATLEHIERLLPATSIGPVFEGLAS